MLRAIASTPAGEWPRAARIASVTLDYDQRRRRRLRLTTDDGTGFLLDLAEAPTLRQGDGLALTGGGWIAVIAAPEPLARITCRDGHHLAVTAWHLGNRHLPTEIVGEALFIRQDTVIEAMAEGLGATVERIERPFNPESGAYAGGGGHSHHPHGHAHANYDDGGAGTESQATAR